MTNTFKIFAAITAATMITACTSSDDAKELGELETEEQAFGKAVIMVAAVIAAKILKVFVIVI